MNERPVAELDLFAAKEVPLEGETIWTKEVDPADIAGLLWHLTRHARPDHLTKAVLHLLHRFRGTRGRE